jgi:hypothetical protein
MDPLRTLVLTRTCTVVLDPDVVASASTRPLRDDDLDRFEAELARLGFAMSFDLAITVRRLPNPALQELRTWLREALAARAPAVVASTCPWCGKPGSVGALEPCGHVVCAACWARSQFAACPICHRRVARHAPRDSMLAVLQLGVDVVTVARSWLAQLLGRPSPLSASERVELELVIDALGPRAAAWLPSHVPVPATLALALARLWLISFDRRAMARETGPHLASATDLLRVAAVLLGGNPELAMPMHFHSVPRALRRAILEALDRVPCDPGELARHRALWQRIGELLHPGELATDLPQAAHAFAIARGDARAQRWAAPLEQALEAGDALTALARLAERPAELVPRMRHVERLARAQSPDAVARFDELRGELLARAARGRGFPRAVLDRALPCGVWESAAIHAAARANVIYVRERDATFTIYRRRDSEPAIARLGRLLAGEADSFRLSAVPTADAPTLAVLAVSDLALPDGSMSPTARELLDALQSAPH